MRGYMLLAVLDFRQSPQDHLELRRRVHWAKKVKEHILFTPGAGGEFASLEQCHLRRKPVLLMSNPVDPIGQDRVTGNECKLLEEADDSTLPLGPLLHETKR